MTEAKIEGDDIVIRVAISAFQTIVDGAWALQSLDTRFKITDGMRFAKDLVMELNEEDEQGTTCLHKAFDDAINRAIENGAEGIDEHEDQDA